ncbi:MAG: hypothetical protein RBT78_13550, partial [Kiritimatiellia bacterium]|nr:hypothetical protein [Kiritimatiellia bacterium]
MIPIFYAAACFSLFSAVSLIAKETRLIIPDEVIKAGPQYAYDLQTASYWTNGLPAAGDTADLFKTNALPYATNSAPLYMEHLKVSAVDFYLRSDQPFILDSATNSILSGTGALKAAFPFVFMAPTRYGLGSQVQLQKPVEFRQGV